jgi:hypothetical protein
MRADRQVQNKRQVEQAAVDLEVARESLLAVRIAVAILTVHGLVFALAC